MSVLFWRVSLRSLNNVGTILKREPKQLVSFFSFYFLIVFKGRYVAVVEYAHLAVKLDAGCYG